MNNNHGKEVMFQGLSTVGQGKLGLVYAIMALTERGYNISIPIIDDQLYDLVADDGKTLLKVQVKSTRFKQNGRDYMAQLQHVHHNKTENVVRKFDNKSVDIVVIVCEDKTVYIIPSDAISAKTAVQLGDKYAKYIHSSMES